MERVPGILKEVVADSVGIGLSTAVLGGVLPDFGTPITRAISAGVVSEVGSVASKMWLYNQPLPAPITFADSALWNAGFMVIGSQVGAGESLAQVTNAIPGVAGNAMLQNALIGGAFAVTGQFARDTVRATYGQSVATDPLAMTLGGPAANSNSGLRLTL